MLHIGKLTDYAVLIISYMARRPAELYSTTLLAAALTLTPSTISKILKMLCQANIVHSMRGVVGGYRLAKQAKTISIAQVIIAMEGGCGITACCYSSDMSSVCVLASQCLLSANWKIINKKVIEFLDRIAITDMLQPLVIQGVLP